MSDPVIDRTMAVRIATQLGWEPKREWVDLTHEEMKEIWDEHGWYVTLFEKVQAKLKEKNSG
jgi:hypothetical protein